ncbi:MAG: hypothetical protein AAFU41_20100 [Pseudomonadota bacterium]
MTTYRIRDAATLAKASYTAGLIVDPPVIHSLDHNDVQAHVLEGNILLLPGSNSVRDYLKFNLRVLNLGNKRLTMSAGGTEKGASGTRWHQGFLQYSRVVFDWLKGLNVTPEYIIGHSLGAAATQILSKSYNAPAIGFAAPRPKKSRNRVVHDGRCLLINRSDDIVPKLPGDFHHMGRAVRFKTNIDRRFVAHSMDRYIAIVDEAVQAQKIPETWGG